MALITNLEPPAGRSVAADSTVSFDVIDPVVADLKIFVWAVFREIGSVELVYDGEFFAASYSASAISSTPGGRKFSVRRVGGWLTSTPELRVDTCACPPELSSGGLTTFANVGTGAGVGQSVLGSTLNLRALQSSDASLTLTQNANDVDIVASEVGGAAFNTVTYTWPAADGAANSFLTTNGAGVLAWSTAALDSLQTAYVAGNTIVTDAGNGDFAVSGTEDITLGGANLVAITTGIVGLQATGGVEIGSTTLTGVLSLQKPDAGTAGFAFRNNEGGLGTLYTRWAFGFDATESFGFGRYDATGTPVENILVFTAGSGNVALADTSIGSRALTLGNTGSGATAIRGGTLDLDSAGTVAIDGAGNTNLSTSAGTLTLENSGAGNITISQSGSGNIALSAAAGAVTVFGTVASSWSVTGAGLTLQTNASGTILIDSAGTLDQNAGTNWDVDVGTSITIDTAAGDIAVTAGNTTGAGSAITFTTGDGGVSEAVQGGDFTVQLGLGDGAGRDGQFILRNSGNSGGDVRMVMQSIFLGSITARSDLFLVTAAPSAQEFAGSIALFNDFTNANTGGRAYIQVDANAGGAGGEGSDWRQLLSELTTMASLNHTITGTWDVVSGDTTLLQMSANNAGAKVFSIDAVNAGAGTATLNLTADDFVTISADGSGQVQLGSATSLVNVIGDLTMSDGGGIFTLGDGTGSPTQVIDKLGTGAAGISFRDAGTTRWLVDFNSSEALLFSRYNSSGVFQEVAITLGAGGAISIGNGAVAKTLTLGNTTGASGTVYNAGSGGHAFTGNIGFFGASPVAQSAAYTPTNVVTDRAYDANSTTLDEVADVLGTLIADLQALGLIG